MSERIIKRYENRKLYDLTDKRYVSLGQIAAMVRHGLDVRITDNATGADLTAETLAKAIAEETAGGTTRDAAQVLHQVIRMGAKAVTGGIDAVIAASIERLGSGKEMRKQVEDLRARIAELENTVSKFADSMEARHGKHYG